FLMEGAARALFVPLSLAVGFAMITSYLLSSTVVPVLCVWLLRHRPGENYSHGPGRWQQAFGRVVGVLTAGRWLGVPASLGGAAAVAVLAWTLLGLEIFPQVDAGQFQLRLKGPDGMRIEQTEDLAREALRLIDEEVPGGVEISLGYVGVVPP